MNSASCNLQTSFAMARSRSWVNTHSFWWIEGKVGETFNLCTMTKRLIPGMSLWLQAKTSWFSLRNDVSAWRTGEGVDPSRSFRPWVIEKYLLQSFNRFCDCLLFFNVHVLQVVVHLQHCYVALSCCHLVPTYLSYSILGGEFDHQMVGRSYGLPRVESRLT